MIPASSALPLTFRNLRQPSAPIMRFQTQLCLSAIALCRESLGVRVWNFLSNYGRIGRCK